MKRAKNHNYIPLCNAYEIKTICVASKVEAGKQWIQ